MVLRAGYLVYSGPTSSCAAYFESLSLSPKPVGVNPAEYVLRVLSLVPLSKEPSLPGVSQEQVINHPSGETVPHLAAAAKAEVVETRDSSFHQRRAVTNDYWAVLIRRLYRPVVCVPLLLRREFYKEWKRLPFWIAFNIRCVLMGGLIGTPPLPSPSCPLTLLTPLSLPPSPYIPISSLCPHSVSLLLLKGLVFYKLEDGDYLGRVSACLEVYMLICAWLLELAPAVHEETVIFYSERELGMVNTLSFWLVSGVPCTIGLLFSSISISIPIYFMSGLRSGASHVAFFVLTLFLSLITNLYLLQLIVAGSPSVTTTMVQYPVC
jgi:hypothetical protein